MKTFYRLGVFFFISFLLTNCAKNDGTAPDMNHLAQQSFNAMFPKAASVSWTEKAEHHVVQFKTSDEAKEAWFDKAGKWQLTETKLSKMKLPAAVLEAFESSEYSSWRIDDIDYVERKDREVIIVIEVEKSNVEVDLYYLSEGTLFKTIIDNDDEDYLPNNLPKEVLDFLASTYPAHKIVDSEFDDGRLEVEIYHDKLKREVLFSADNNWIRTTTELSIKAVPQSILNVLKSSKYSSYTIDDVDHIVTPKEEFYIFELEFINSEIDVRIYLDGTIEVRKD